MDTPGGRARCPKHVDLDPCWIWADLEPPLPQRFHHFPREHADFVAWCAGRKLVRDAEIALLLVRYRNDIAIGEAQSRIDRGTDDDKWLPRRRMQVEIEAVKPRILACR